YATRAVRSARPDVGRRSPRPVVPSRASSHGRAATSAARASSCSRTNQRRFDFGFGALFLAGAFFAAAFGAVFATGFAATFATGFTGAGAGGGAFTIGAGGGSMDFVTLSGGSGC